MADTVVNIKVSGRTGHVFNIDMARLMHRHGDQWIEMTPIADHSPDPRDPERRLLRGEQVYRCSGCDDEMQFVPKDSSG